jgi:predicted phage tail protein
MSVQFQLEYRLASSSGSWTTSTFTCTAKKTSAARFQTELVLPTRDIYDVQIERLTPEDPNDDSQQRSASYLTSFEEIIDVAQYYPGMQIISLSVKATDIRSGTLDVIRVHHNKTLMDIPYFDSTGYKTVDATIPAYQFIDIFTNLYYGARGNIDSVDQDRIEEWVAWTEGLVGGNPRAKCNIVFDERGTFADVVTAIEQAGRARVTRVGSIWSCIVDKPKVSQYTFSAGNIIKDSFDWSGYEDPEKADGVEVSFWNDTRNGQKDSRKAMASWFDTMARVPKIASVEIRGIIDADQAQRQAQFMVNKNEFITRHGKLKSFMRSALVELGDVVNIIPPVSKYVAGGMFSRDHYSFSTVYLDQWVLLDATTYSGKLHLYVVDSTGVEQIFEVLGPWDTRTFTLNLDAPLTAKRHDVWGLGRLSEDKLANQIVKKRINPDKKNVDLEWCQYDERIFYHADWDAGLVEI